MMSARWESILTTVVAVAVAGAVGGAAAASGIEVEQRDANARAFDVAQADTGAPAGQDPADAESAEAPDIEEPDDPVAQAAFDALDKHCARCHQVGRLNRQRPSKNFGNVLQLDELATDSNFVLPGNPDGSKVYATMANLEMPYDVYQEFSGGDEPTEAELQAVYDWIRSLEGTLVTDRDPIAHAQIVTAIFDDIEAQPEHRRKGMRYITLSHLYAAGASDKNMQRFRQGAVKLLNSLSTNPDVLRKRTIDEAETIVAFNLDDLNWTEADWNRIVANNPYRIRPDTPRYDLVARVTGTPLPWVRGDWFAFTASRPPLYHDLLKLPDTFQELQKVAGVDVDANIEALRAQRAGFARSGVSKHNRLIERHSIATGYFWTSYDFAGDKPEQSLFVRPLGPKGDDAFVADGGESIYSLPNGFQAYYLNEADGTRLDKGPTEIVLDDSQADRTVTNGISCFGCHNQGIRRATDDIRPHVLADRTFPREVREKVEALYPPAEEMNRLLDEDYNRFVGAMRRAGLDPELDSQNAGVESINFLSQQYEKAVDLRLAAAEYGIAPEDLSAGLGAAGGEAFRTNRRLQQGVIPRDTFEARFVQFVAHVTDDLTVDVTASATPADTQAAVATVVSSAFDLELTSDKSEYSVNDLAVFTVRSSKACHLTLINVDGKGEGTVIFPNQFQQNNELEANQDIQFPGADAPFQFRLADAGTESVIAVCNTDGPSSGGIQHDFATRSFTPLGDYRAFTTRQIAVEARERTESAKASQPASEGAATPVLARTAIRFEVK